MSSALEEEDLDVLRLERSYVGRKNSCIVNGTGNTECESWRERFGAKAQEVTNNNLGIYQCKLIF